MPATKALSERSYSALRRIKNYLRSTMTQKMMNNLMLMSVYKAWPEISDRQRHEVRAHVIFLSFR